MKTNSDKKYTQPVVKVVEVLFDGLLCQSQVTEDVDSNWGQW